MLFFFFFVSAIILALYSFSLFLNISLIALWIWLEFGLISLERRARGYFVTLPKKIKKTDRFGRWIELRPGVVVYHLKSMTEKRSKTINLFYPCKQFQFFVYLRKKKKLKVYNCYPQNLWKFQKKRMDYYEY